MLPDKIILQKGYPSPVENSAVIVTCALRDIELIRQDIDNISPIPDALPIGSVEFMRKYMELSNIQEPINISYPQEFTEHYHRNITTILKKHVPDNVFVKPIDTKLFTGFVYNKKTIDPNHEYNSIPNDTTLYISDVVNFIAEWRCYISNYKLIGIARYDDNDEEHDETMVKLFVNSLTEKMAIKYGSIDVGLLDNYRMSIVECNDAWSLGLYKGSISNEDYISMLWGRWVELSTKGIK